MRILVTEDHPDLQLELLDYLQAQGFQADAADSIASMNEKLHQCQYQVLLLDLSLPDGDGIEQLPALRNEFGLTLGIVVVSARGQPQQRTKAMQLGADAYLVKPVYLPELLALLQQLQQRLQPAAEEHWQLDLERSALFSPQGKVIALSQNEAKILAALEQEQQSKAMLLKQLAPYLLSAHDYGRLDTLICRLRRKVEQSSGETLPLQTIRNQGYRLLDTQLRR